MKYIFILLGLLFATLGAIGIALPVLPTTPFLLLSAVCFAKGSNKFYNWFLSTKLYKNNLESFAKNKSMTRKTKLCILLPVTLMLTVAFFMMSNIYGKIFIVILILCKYYYFIFKIKTIKE